MPDFVPFHAWQRHEQTVEAAEGIAEQRAVASSSASVPSHETGKIKGQGGGVPLFSHLNDR